MKVQKIALLGVLLAATIVIAILESFIPSFIIPGIKLGFANIVILVILFYLVIKKFSIIGVSVVGALFHVIGQIIIAMIYMGTVYVVYYLPIIALAAVITGTLVGIIAKAIIKTNVIKKQREKYNF